MQLHEVDRFPLWVVGGQVFFLGMQAIMVALSLDNMQQVELLEDLMKATVKHSHQLSP